MYACVHACIGGECIKSQSISVKVNEHPKYVSRSSYLGTHPYSKSVAVPGSLKSANLFTNYGLQNCATYKIVVKPAYVFLWCCRYYRDRIPVINVSHYDASGCITLQQAVLDGTFVETHVGEWFGPTYVHFWHISVFMSTVISQFPICFLRPLFGRPYYRSSLWHSISSVCRLSSVCRRRLWRFVLWQNGAS